MAYAFNNDKSKLNIDDVVRESDIDDVVREADIDDVVRENDISDVVRGPIVINCNYVDLEKTFQPQDMYMCAIPVKFADQTLINPDEYIPIALIDFKLKYGSMTSDLFISGIEFTIKEDSNNNKYYELNVTVLRQAADGAGIERGINMSLRYLFVKI